jgi:hypothetical protein
MIRSGRNSGKYLVGKLDQYPLSGRTKFEEELEETNGFEISVMTSSFVVEQLALLMRKSLDVRGSFWMDWAYGGRRIGGRGLSVGLEYVELRLPILHLSVSECWCSSHQRMVYILGCSGDILQELCVVHLHATDHCRVSKT